MKVKKLNRQSEHRGSQRSHRGSQSNLSVSLCLLCVALCNFLPNYFLKPIKPQPAKIWANLCDPYNLRPILSIAHATTGRTPGSVLASRTARPQRAG
jgi:hypothetical protein